MKEVLITGGAGGLGRITSEYLASKGWHVFALDLEEANTRKHEHPGVTPVSADITSETSVSHAFSYVSGKTDGLDAIVHLAGILVIGSLVEIPNRDIERIMNINLLGAYRINKIFLPLVYQKKGRIIAISSETGWQRPAPFNGPYAMSKHALEAYCDALRRELDLLDIRVITIQPGPLKTGLTDQVTNLFAVAIQSSQYFSKHLEAARNLLNNIHNKAGNPQRLVGVIDRALSTKNPSIRYSVMPDRARSALEWLPVRWADRIYRKVLTARHRR